MGEPLTKNGDLLGTLNDNFEIGAGTTHGLRRSGNDISLRDAAAGEHTLTQLLDKITQASHRTLRQLIHFIDDGPAEGFASLAYREITGTTFPTKVIWYEDSTKAKKIVEKTITWTGVFPSVIAWQMYATDGATVVATVSDAITWSGAFETDRTRTITVP